MTTMDLSNGPGTRDVDGRNIDRAIGGLSGEGSLQRVDSKAVGPGPRQLQTVHGEPVEPEAGPSYYGLPLLKEPVWKWYIPTYFYVGGVAGAAAALGAAAQLTGASGSARRSRDRAEESWHRLVRRCRIAATAGAAMSAGLLIADLGRPARFVNMLRVFRPTSPMNMGTWILSAFGGSVAAATAAHVLPLPSILRRAGDTAAIAAGIMGLPLCTYTGVLIANTAVPIWQGTRRSLPVLFAASGAAGAASLFELWPPGGMGDVVVHRFALAGKALELALSEAFAREAHSVSRVGRPLRHGASAVMWKAAQGLSLAGLTATVFSRPGSRLRRTAGVLGTVGALMLRFAVVQAGRASSRDPHATAAQQRAGRGARDVVTDRDQAGASRPALRAAGASWRMEQGERGQHA